MMAVARNRLTILRLERDNLIDRWMINKNTDNAKILVKIMDLEEDIAKAMNEQK